MLSFFLSGHELLLYKYNKGMDNLALAQKLAKAPILATEAITSKGSYFTTAPIRSPSVQMT